MFLINKISETSTIAVILRREIGRIVPFAGGGSCSDFEVPKASQLINMDSYYHNKANFWHNSQGIIDHETVALVH